ncbi:MAG: trigger factor [Planctomycetota bacterium]|jgi:trigger factor
MQFDVSEAGPCRKRVSVKIPQERVSEEFDKSYRNWTRSVPIAGFRPGKAPRKLVEKRFGEQVALEVKQTLLDAAFEEALEKNDLAPIADPDLKLDEIEVEQSKELEFDFTVTVKPEFELPDLKGIEVSVPNADPSAEELDAALLDLRKRRATLRPVEDGKVETGDVVSLKVMGTAGEEQMLAEDNLPYEVGTSWLSGLVADGLDDVLVGSKVGATVTAKASAAPHSEGHHLAGHELDIEAEVLDIKRPDLPELDDELAKAFDFDTADELKEVVEKDVRAHKERDRERAIENLALAELAERVEFDLPQELIEREVEDLARRAAYEMQLQKKSESEIAQKIAEVRAQRAGESAKELKAFFILDKIVEKEKVLVTENEVREAVTAIAAYNQTAPDQMYAQLRDSGRLGSLRNQLREKKAREKLRKRVKVSEAAAPADKKATAKKKAAAKKATKKKTTKKKAD